MKTNHQKTGSAKAVGGWFALVPGIFGILGTLWIVLAVRTLSKRAQMAIVITSEGIELPSVTVFGKGGNRIMLAQQNTRTRIASTNKPPAFVP